MEKLDRKTLHWLKSVIGQLKSKGYSQKEALKTAREKAVTIAFYSAVYSGRKNIQVTDPKPYHEIIKLLD